MPPSESILSKLPEVPDLPGAYTMRDAAGEVLYVGKAKSLRKRLRAHFREGAPTYGWTQQLYAAAEDIEYTVTGSELEALLLEASLIKEHKPRYNIRLNNDQSYPYLKLTDEFCPRLVVLRDLPRGANVPLPGRAARRKLQDPKRREIYGMGAGKLFGPFPEASAMWRTMRMVAQLFGLRGCRRKLDGQPCGKPCLNLHIGRCVGPCRGLEFVSEADYAEVVRQTVSFLEGRTVEVAEGLERDMKAAAAELQFERAAKLRDKLKAVNRATEQQVMVADDARDQDVIAVALTQDSALAVLFQVRAGRLVKQEQFELANTNDRTPAEMVDAFLIQYYSYATQVPREVLVSEEIEERETWAQLLTEARGGTVHVHHPQRGEKRRLTELAHKNATLALDTLLKRRAEQDKLAKNALEDLADALALPAPPRRIECFDISTTGGRDSTGAQVVFTDGKPDKRSYRRFKMRATEGKPDDFAMIAEMVQRRLRSAAGGNEKFLPLPDLILVDGGKGQLSTVLAVLQAEAQEGIALASLAKQQEEVFLPEASLPVDMTTHTAAQYLLQRIRDEAHRFAITHHRGLRDSQLTRSTLEQVPGIGPERRKALLRAFPSVQAMAHSTIDELAAVPGMTHKAAEDLLRFLTAAPEDSA